MLDRVVSIRDNTPFRAAPVLVNTSRRAARVAWAVASFDNIGLRRDCSISRNIQALDLAAGPAAQATAYRRSKAMPAFAALSGLRSFLPPAVRRRIAQHLLRLEFYDACANVARQTESMRAGSIDKLAQHLPSGNEATAQAHLSQMATKLSGNAARSQDDIDTRS